MTPEFIVIHHSLTKDSGTVSWGAIRKYHLQQGWGDIGYHWGVELVSDYYEVLMGRTMAEPGAHAKEADMNQRSIGICLVGNFDEQIPVIAQLQATGRLVRFLMRLYNLNTTQVIGHHDVGLMVGLDWKQEQYKSCPGRLFQMQYFKGMLA